MEQAKDEDFILGGRHSGTFGGTNTPDRRTSSAENPVQHLPKQNIRVLRYDSLCVHGSPCLYSPRCFSLGCGHTFSLETGFCVTYGGPHVEGFETKKGVVFPLPKHCPQGSRIGMEKCIISVASLSMFCKRTRGLYTTVAAQGEPAINIAVQVCFF